VTLTLDGFIDLWYSEAEHAQKILSLLTDQSLYIKNQNGRESIAQAAWELVLNPIKTLAKSGFHISYPALDEAPPLSIRKMREDHIAVIRSVREQVTKLWGRNPLQEPDQKIGDDWAKESTLLRLLSKQITLRRHLMTLMHQQGISIPEFHLLPPEI
jgi:hypothetical protein